MVGNPEVRKGRDSYRYLPLTTVTIFVVAGRTPMIRCFVTAVAPKSTGPVFATSFRRSILRHGIAHDLKPLPLHSRGEPLLLTKYRLTRRH
jgi:hypothetical protein